MDKKKKIIKIIATILVFVGLTITLYFVGFKGDWIKPIIQNSGWFGYILYVIIQVAMTTLLTFVPATTFTFTLLSVQIFGTIQGMIISIVACWISSMVMFAIGKYGGVKFVDWLIGKDDREKAQKMVDGRATVLVPVMLACPFFPDDAICMISGITNMNFWYFSATTLFTRSIGICSTALFGNGATLEYIKNALGDNIVLWVIAINTILIDVWAIWKLSNKMQEIINKKREKKENEMRLKPKSTVHNPRALVYRRFIGLEKSINLATVYFTLTDSKYWTFDNETLEFSQIDASLIPTESVVTKITDLITILTYQGNYFRYTGTQWEKVNSLNTDITLLSATFNNIAKYQTNKYYYVGSFDYMIKGSVDGATTQYIKGNIIPLTSLNIKYFDDSINLAVDDLVVIDKKLYSVENPETVKKMQPKAFNIYFATLNSIL